MEYTAKSIINRAFNLADLKNTDFISYEEQEQYLNDAFVSVMSSLINKGVKQFVREVSLTGQSFYPFTEYTIPHDLYQICSVKTPNGFIYTRKSESQPLGSNTYDIVNDKLRIYGSPITSNIILTYWIKPLYLSFPNRDIDTNIDDTIISSAGNSVLYSDGIVHNCITDENIGNITPIENNILGNGHILKYGNVSTECGLINDNYFDTNGNIIEKPEGQLDEQTNLGNARIVDDKLYSISGSSLPNRYYYTLNDNSLNYSWTTYTGPTKPEVSIQSIEGDVGNNFYRYNSATTIIGAELTLSDDDITQILGDVHNKCSTNNNDLSWLRSNFTTTNMSPMSWFSEATWAYGDNSIDGNSNYTIMYKLNNVVKRFISRTESENPVVTLYNPYTTFESGVTLMTWQITIPNGALFNSNENDNYEVCYYSPSVNINEIEETNPTYTFVDEIMHIGNGGLINSITVEDYSNYTIKPIISFNKSSIIYDETLNQNNDGDLMYDIIHNTTYPLVWQNYVAAKLLYVDYNDNVICSKYFNAIERQFYDNNYNIYYTIWNPSTNYYDIYLMNNKINSIQENNYIMKYDNYWIDNDFNIYDLNNNKLSDNPIINDVIDVVYPVERFDERVAFIFKSNNHYYLNTLNEDYTWHTDAIDNNSPIVAAILKYGLLTSNGTDATIKSYIPDTKLNFPNQLLWQIMACDLAIRFVLKQNGDVTSLNTLYQDMWLQFMNTIDMDADYERIKNVY